MNAKHLITISALFFSHLALAQSVVPASIQKNASMPNLQVSNPVQSITKAEAKHAGITLIVENFDKIDANRDGIVTRAELRSYLLANRRHVPMT
ncbi:EF-hand domain-containing protein [Oxalicibacterium faecigallinarum]|nr:EF-hand domain-containing protein [Oxalicibacterium faecigallinarum]